LSRQQGLEQLTNDSPGKRRLELAAARLQHFHPDRGRPQAAFGDDGRLADASGTFDDHESTATFASVLQRGVDHRELPCTLQQHCLHDETL
jgi:hypothetical protein